MSTARAVHSSLPATFAALSALHPLRPIRDAVDYDNATEVLDRLAVLDCRTADQEDYLETLATLVGKYDAEHYAADLSQLSPLASLAFLMEHQGMNGSQLGELLGNNRSLGGKILRGDRQLSKAHIRILATRFKVSPALFL
jgi:HTH-type transcriptional regulator / antitoxin HigA